MKNKISSLLFLFIITIIKVNAGNKIKVFFNHPVDTSVSTTIPATYLNNCMADTLVAYINRAKYSIDISQYDYDQGSFANIATAVNNAYSRGVNVRWIYDGSSSNSGVSLLNPAIHTLGSPTTSAYNIMHDKITTIDANSTNPNDAIVITGSFDWFSDHFSTLYNNNVVIQDSALAHAYTDEFNMMWGSTGLVPNASLAKFGPYKTDLGRHFFTVEGKTIELYFSPSDGTESHIQSTINTANTDLYFAVYTFTSATDANMIVNKHVAGVYVAGIIDQFSNSYAPYSIFTSGLGSNFISYSGSTIYHNKFLIVDQANKCSDPMVLTGSHNWTTTANTKNDENILIIHDDTVANMYYQSFHNDFISNGGALTVPLGCNADVQNVSPNENSITIYPNPSDGTFTVNYTLPTPQKVSIEIYNVIGQKVAIINKNEAVGSGLHSQNFTLHENGIYFIQFTFGEEHFNSKLVISSL